MSLDIIGGWYGKACSTRQLHYRGVNVRFRVKWRARGEEPLRPEEFMLESEAKARARELLVKYGSDATIDVWNDDETWQIVAPYGVPFWSHH
jgi:hypothetical protein